MNTSRPELNMVIKEIFSPQYTSCSPEEITAYYQTRTSVRYFPVADEIYTTRDKIDNILDGLFEFNAKSYRLSDNFDWANNPSRDVEWLIMLHKFYYAVGLGVAYHETKDLRYAEKWVELISSWIDAVSPGFLSSDVAGRRIQNWIFAQYYFVTVNQAPVISPAFYMKFLKSIYSQVNHLCGHLTPARNHRTLELYAIFLSAVVFPEMKGAEDWLKFSIRELLKNIQADILPDGVHCELSTDYHHLVLKNYLGIRKLAFLNQIVMPKEMDLLIEKALEFSLYVHKPDGMIPSLSDGDARSFLDLLEQGYQLYGSEEMRYVASKGVSGRAPSLRSKGFPASGYYILRSGWGSGKEPYEDERYLVFDCGPLGDGNHGHFDLLSLEVAAYGQSLIVDPGRYTYDESGDTNWRVHFRGTACHNTVMVDNKNQTAYHPDKNKFKIKGPAPDRKLKLFVSGPGFDYLHGIGRSHEYEAVHERKIFFVGPEYWIISDLLLATEFHEYDLFFHLSAESLGRVSTAVEQGTLVIDAPHLVIAQASDQEVNSNLEEGYISPSYGVKHRAPVIRFSRHAADAYFNTILFPYKFERPAITVEKLSVSSGTAICPETQASAICISIERGGQQFRDYYFVTHRDPGRAYTFGDVTFNGTLLYCRMDRDNNIVQRYSV